ncbi:hypothetical protein FOZ62_008406, partial [Perkinsus olseni]
MNRIVDALNKNCPEAGHIVTAFHVPGNTNCLADMLSRADKLSEIIPMRRRGWHPLAENWTGKAMPSFNAKDLYGLCRSGIRLCIYFMQEPRALTVGIPSFPADPEALCGFIVALTQRGLMYETVKKYFDTVKVRNRLWDPEKMTPLQKESIRLHLLASKRILRNRRRKRTVTLTKAQVELVSRSVPPSKRKESTTAYLLGVHALLRLKEIIALRKGDIEFIAGQAGAHHMRVNVRQSKTDQSASGQYVIVGCRQKEGFHCGDPACAMHRVQQHLAARPGPLHASLFDVTYSQLSYDIQALVEIALSDQTEAVIGRVKYQPLVVRKITDVQALLQEA